MPFQIPKNKFLHNGILFNLFSKLLYYFIAFPILTIINKVFLGFKIEGFKNLHTIDGGKITVSNHVHYLDCTMMGLANFPNQNYFLSLESNFEIPFVKWLITILKAIPIPKNKEFTHDFMNSIDGLLQEGKTVHIYPEGSLLPYCTDLRNFKKGAFSFAVRNNIPIVPCTFVFNKPQGIYQYFKKKPVIHLIISAPIYPNLNLEKGKAILDLRNRVYNEMRSVIMNNNTEQMPVEEECLKV